MQVKAFIKAFIKASHEERMEFFKYIFKRTKEKFVNYWLGYVDVLRYYIYTGDKKKLYTFSIIAGRYGKGVWFSELNATDIPKLIETIKQGLMKPLQLYVDYGYGGTVYNEYVFNKRQTRLLLQQLEQTMAEEEIYYGDKTD